MNFIGQLVHRLQVGFTFALRYDTIADDLGLLQEDLFDVLDQLIGPLIVHTNGVLAQPVTGTDDQVTHMDTKRAYLTLLNSIMSSKLYGVFTSERESTSRNILI